MDKQELRTFEKGEVIFEQGSYQRCMYDILRGKVGIYVNYGKEGEKLLTELAPGQSFGEMALIECRPRSATAVALEETAAELITAENFSQYFSQHSDKLFDIMRQMSRRIRELTEDYMEACHTVAEMVDTEKSGKEKSGWLIKNLKKFGDAYEESAKLATQYGADPYFMSYFGGWHM